MSLTEFLIEKIKNNGPITIDQYMDICLNHCQKGYYKNSSVFGQEGDFITAPEISQIFGECLAFWLICTYQEQGCPKHYTLCEIGAGRGTLMDDILRTISKLCPQILSGAKIKIVETSPKMIAKQKQTLEKYKNLDISWQEKFENFCTQPLYLIANEFLDAIPTKQYQKVKKDFFERVITYNNGKFCIEFDKNKPLLNKKFCDHYDQLNNGDIVEISPLRENLIKQIATNIAKCQGSALFIDYGEIKPCYGDTLQAVYKHSYFDIFQNPGKADLTTHVDFFKLAQIAKSTGCDCYGKTQGALLSALEIVRRTNILCKNQPNFIIDQIKEAAARLVDPMQMGSLFKALLIVPANITNTIFDNNDLL